MRFVTKVKELKNKEENKGKLVLIRCGIFDPTRADNDFFVLLGPGRNMTYASGDSAMATSETQSSNKNDPEKITNQLGIVTDEKKDTVRH